MAFQLSPGVNVSEIDLTTVVPAVGTTEGAFVGEFTWGPVNEIRTISSEIELVNTFGKPNGNNFTDFFTAANFLAYARNLKVVRATANTSYNATSNTGTIYIENEEDYLENHSNGANTVGMWAAKYPGTLGNSLKVSIFTGSNTAAFANWTYNGYFDSVPGTSTYATNRSSFNDEMHIAVIDTNGSISGTANTVIERFAYVSKASDAKLEDGTSNYYKDVINSRSSYLWWLSHPDGGIGMTLSSNNWGSSASSTTYGSSNTAYTTSLSSGSLVSATASDITLGYDKFKNADEVDVSLIMTSDHNSSVINHVIDNIAEYRKDCVVFLSPLRSDVVNSGGNEADDCISFRNSTINRSTSYAVMDSNWKYQYDKYNDTYRWVPLNGDIAGLCVRTDFERDPWFSPAGFNRGQIRNVVRLAWNPDKTDRDELYKNGINPVVSFPGEGTILYGDKTMLAKPSAFDRINVRRLFIVLEKAIARAAKFSLFEFNDAFTRAQFIALVEPYLRDVQGRRGIYDFRVVCDETNNTPEVIDRNEFIGDIYIKPARSINFIQLNFVAVRTGVAFDEVVGRF
jgi:Phage tail sheath protein subtilisin-like domain/Phage tail sheath C-terminal domain